MTIYPPNDPFVFETEFISIKWYGFFIALAILLSYLLVLRKIRSQHISESNFDLLFILTVISGVIGARLGFVFQNFFYFKTNIIEIFKLTDGGLSIHGAIILGVSALWVVSKKLKLKFSTLANLMAPYLLLSGAIGRWGNFFNQEIMGKPTESIIKLFVDPDKRPLNFENISHFHPVFLYESLLLFLFFVIYFMIPKVKQYALSYTLIVYSLARIIVEFFRIDYKPIFIGLDLAQLVSLGILLLGVTLFFSKPKHT